MDDTKPNRPPWEDQWQQAFDGAETPPSEHVWKNIEGQLAVQESGKYRRGFLLYRAVAAVFLLLIAGLSWYILAQRTADSPDAVVDLTETQPQSSRSADHLAAASQRQTPRSAQDITVPDPAFSDTSTVLLKAPPAESPQVAEAQSGEAHRARQASDDASNTAGLASAAASAASVAGTSRSSELDQSALPPSGTLAKTERSLLSTDQQRYPTAPLVAPVASGSVADASAPQLPDQSEAILYRVPQIPTDDPKKERQPIAFFAGLSLAPGYFDPQFQANPGNPEAVALGPSPSSSFNNAMDLRSADAYGTSASSSTIGIENTPELSFSYGFDVGMRLAEHWVLEGGVDYNRFVTSTASRWVVADIASGERFAYVATNASTLDNNMNQSPNISTDLNNGYEFIAVPVKVGYRRSVSKFQFTLSSGVAANFFLQNAISASHAASQLSTYRISASEEGSPFNNVYYSGLLSGGVNYNVLGRYFLSLTPTYTFALTPLTRGDSQLGSNAYSLGVNVGFQYQF